MAELLYSTDQIRDMDARAIASGIDAFDLMCQAAASAWRQMQKLWPDAERIAVLCGPGNNGGDGLVMASLAREQGLDVTAFLMVDSSRLKGAAAQAWQLARQSEVAIKPWQNDDFYNYCRSESASVVIVDAMLGNGARAGLTGDFLAATERVNSLDLPVLAIDQPTGVNANSGSVKDVAVRASATISFIARTQGLYTGDAVDYCGRHCFDNLGLPERLGNMTASWPPVARAIFADDALEALQPRAKSAHKGAAGRAVVVGGDDGFGGAALLTAGAAVRGGAGTVTLLTRSQHRTAMLVRQPEVMVQPVDDWHVLQGAALRSLLTQASALAIGPGLGKSDWSINVLREILDWVADAGAPLVLDADALNLLAMQKLAWGDLAPAEARARWVITPHPGEAARLLGCSVAEIQSDRFAAVRKLQSLAGTVCLLKGAGSLLAFPDSDVIDVCMHGNPGMASGGMGDVLSGFMVALLAQGLPSADAARLAVCLHAKAADLLAAQFGERGLLASDLPATFRKLLNKMQDSLV
ncbi:NAD(P)H-hydrate dehydratase [Pseudohongiella sp. SYSU M77423]|uniref:NAD(P)H-hydrate dehydratase n=1 Tax=Pseudohongiella sp. SYSU M77423 TaxID=3042312 RepID=UPI00248065F1|nr:NAD(P)H-hydrate dehydratase [Pseudohongiella sp. SYSU M77423]MDH7943989.1 NAD(P)H-hydrate dehydratase [Pseudohongiella sp. SYSU M77423]